MRGLGFRLAVPFELIGMEDTTPFFQIIDLSLFLGAPIPCTCPSLIILKEFFSLGYDEILPKRSHIQTPLQLPEMGNDGISDAVVIKVDLPAFFQFRPEVSAERTQPENDIGLFQDRDIFFDRLRIQPRKGR